MKNDVSTSRPQPLMLSWSEGKLAQKNVWGNFLWQMFGEGTVHEKCAGRPGKNVRGE